MEGKHARSRIIFGLEGTGAERPAAGGLRPALYHQHRRADHRGDAGQLSAARGRAGLVLRHLRHHRAGASRGLELPVRPDLLHRDYGFLICRRLPLGGTDVGADERGQGAGVSTAGGGASVGATTHVASASEINRVSPGSHKQ